MVLYNPFQSLTQGTSVTHTGKFITTNIVTTVISNFIFYVLTLHIINRMSTKGGGSRNDWSVMHAAHIKNWNESSAFEVVHLAGPYDHLSYGEYLSWYVA